MARNRTMSEALTELGHHIYGEGHELTHDI